MRPGTTITFLGCFPSSHLAASGALRAAVSTSWGVAEAAISRVKRTLPLKLTGYFVTLSTKYFSSN